MYNMQNRIEDMNRNNFINGGFIDYIDINSVLFG